MHLLEIVATQPGFGNHLGKLRSQTTHYGKGSSRPFFCGNEKGFFSAWKLFGIGKDLNFNFGRGHERLSDTLVIRAVATALEPKRLVNRKDTNGHLGLTNSQLIMDKSSPKVQTKSPNEDSSEDLDDKEKLRRTRISKANKGNTPWNKGKKHSPETLQRIRERTRIAMQDPKVKMKLVNLGHAQSQETRVKIGVGVRRGWQKRKKKLYLQESCYFEWNNLIAEASRKGYDHEAELEWNSYEVLNEKLKEEWLESVERRKKMPRPKGSKRAPKSPEQRRKISEAISRKWADSSYRERVVSALAKYHGIEPGAERKTRKKPRDGSQTPRKSPAKKDSSLANWSSTTELKIQTTPKLKKRKGPLYKDPMASSKLEMIKNIRAQRASVETKKTEAIERAKLLIAEAEKAAKSLEIAAMKSPIARASLIETRKLIAEAVRSIESIETEPIPSYENSEDLQVVPDELGSLVVSDTEASPAKVNGTQTLAPSNVEDNIGFGNDEFKLKDVLNGEEGIFPMSSTSYGLSPFGYDNLMKQSDSTNEDGRFESKCGSEKQEKPLVNGAATKVEARKEEGSGVETLTGQVAVKTVTVTKKWVCGRLIEVTEDAA